MTYIHTHQGRVEEQVAAAVKGEFKGEWSKGVVKGQIPEAAAWRRGVPSSSPFASTSAPCVCGMQRGG
eukprot:2006260-Rhodomonas_salina.1